MEAAEEARPGLLLSGHRGGTGAWCLCTPVQHTHKPRVQPHASVYGCVFVQGVCVHMGTRVCWGWWGQAALCGDASAQQQSWTLRQALRTPGPSIPAVGGQGRCRRPSRLRGLRHVRRRSTPEVGKKERGRATPSAGPAAARRSPRPLLSLDRPRQGFGGAWGPPWAPPPRLCQARSGLPPWTFPSPLSEAESLLGLWGWAVALPEWKGRLWVAGPRGGTATWCPGVCPVQNVGEARPSPRCFSGWHPQPRLVVGAWRGVWPCWQGALSTWPALPICCQAQLTSGAAGQKTEGARRIV